MVIVIFLPMTCVENKKNEEFTLSHDYFSGILLGVQ